MKISRVGVDLAKNVFQLHGVDRHGETVLKRRLSRDKWIRVLVNSAEPGCEIGMEACGGAHHWARLLMKKGFRVRRFKSTAQAQRFVTAHAAVSNLFNLGRHLVRARYYRGLRTSAFAEWRRAVA